MPTEKEVKDMFKEEVETFIAVFPRVKGVRFVVEAKHYRDSPRKRDIAWYDTNEHSVHLIRAALSRSLDCLRGVIRHELGHVADARINSPGAERRADSLAEKATGKPILYTAEGLQHATRGEAYRPDWLHQ